MPSCGPPVLPSRPGWAPMKPAAILPASSRGSSKKRPYVILKLAVSADGKIAAGPGQRTAITGPEAKARVHLLRAQCDAILVGMGTVLADDPELTCRLPGLEAPLARSRSC